MLHTLLKSIFEHCLSQYLMERCVLCECVYLCRDVLLHLNEETKYFVAIWSLVMQVHNGGKIN